MASRIDERCWYSKSTGSNNFRRGVLLSWGADGSHNRNTGGHIGVVKDVATGQCFSVPVSCVWFTEESPAEVTDDPEHEE